ncbi:MAG TPA: phosphatase PAP2 family protein [Ramlibacter sp.]|jgi:undecaprenyl-diphosphatase|nr:phosphatase PAP2 family protein [Ramlibacter sp.]
MAASQPARSLNVRAQWRPLLAAFCIAVFVLLALQVALQGPLLQLDDHITAWMVPHRRAWLTGAFLFVTDLHDTVGVLAATASLIAWCTWRRDWPGVSALLVVPTGMLLNVVLKESFERARPALEPLVHLATYSFPSGHAVAATVFYGIVCSMVVVRSRSELLRGLAVALSALMVLLVVASRVYLGAHFATDVIAGLAVGTLCVLLFQRFLLRPP